MTDDLELRSKQATAQAVLNQFAKARPQQTVRIVVAACDRRGLASCRGICNYNQTRPTRPTVNAVPLAVSACPPHEPPVPPPGDSSGLPHELRDLENIARIQALRIGDWMHLVVCTSVPGFLHMFNLGTSGAPAKLFPLRRADAQYLSSDQWIYVSERFTGVPEMYEETGPATPWPERLLAVVTRENLEVTLGDLYAGWGAARTTPVHRPLAEDADAWAIDRSGEWFWDLPNDAWQWGLCEVPLESTDHNGDGSAEWGNQ